MACFRSWCGWKPAVNSIKPPKVCNALANYSTQNLTHFAFGLGRWSLHIVIGQRVANFWRHTIITLGARNFCFHSYLLQMRETLMFCSMKMTKNPGGWVSLCKKEQVRRGRLLMRLIVFNSFNSSPLGSWASKHILSPTVFKTERFSCASRPQYQHVTCLTQTNQYCRISCVLVRRGQCRVTCTAVPNLTKLSTVQQWYLPVAHFTE